MFVEYSVLGVVEKISDARFDEENYSNEEEWLVVSSRNITQLKVNYTFK